MNWRRMSLAAGTALIAVVVCAYLFAGGRSASGRADPAVIAPPVHVVIVQKSDFKIILRGLGTAQPVNSVLIRSRVDGQVVTVNFKEGQMVNEGDLLVQIDPAPYKAVLDQATAKLGQDQATLDNAQQELARTQTLAGHGNATQQLLDQRVATVAQTKALIEADKANIQSAQVQLGYTTIRAPLKGRAGFRNVDPGNIVHASDQTGILTITQLQPIAVLFTAPEQDLPRISTALKGGGSLPLTAMSSDGKQRLADGSLNLIDNQVDAASGTIRLKGIFENADLKLWPGLSVQTELLVDTLHDRIVIPDAAVQRGPNGLYAFVASADSTAVLRPLKVGRIDSGEALVEDGLQPGERIVTSGHYKVLANRKVDILDDRRPGDASAKASTKDD